MHLCGKGIEAERMAGSKTLRQGASGVLNV
jgi:hypothetical protein